MTLPWYETRKAFKRRSVLMDTARKLDAELKWRCDQSPGAYQQEEKVYTFPRTDFGRVTWDMTYQKYHSCAPFYVGADRFPEGKYEDGMLVPASNLVIPNIPEDAVPRHMANGIDIPSIDEIDDGFELFGGCSHPTEVYFLEGALSGLIKIGIASSLSSRVASIRTSTPEPLSLICHLPANQYFEKFMHGLFEPLRHHGEWFYPHWTIHSVIMGLKG